MGFPDDRLSIAARRVTMRKTKRNPAHKAKPKPLGYVVVDDCWELPPKEKAMGRPAREPDW